MLPAAPAAQTLPAVAISSPSLLPVLVNAALAAHVSQLVELVSAAAESDLQLMRRAWREGRRAEVDEWLDRFRPGSPRLSTLAPAVAAAILRFRAGTFLESQEGVDEAENALEQARLLDPVGDERRLRALLIWRRGDLDGALAALGDMATVAALNLRAGILLEADNPHAALEVLKRADLDSSSSVDDRADALRLQAIALFATGDLVGAISSIRQAELAAPTWQSLRVLGAQIRYFGALSPVARPATLPTWPQPIDRGLLRRDEPSAVLLDEALSALRGLSEELPRDARRRLDAWRLACLTAHPSLADEVASACSDLLAQDPAHIYAISWVAYHSLPLDLEVSLAAARDELVGGGVDHRVFLLAGSLLAMGRGVEAAATLDQVQGQVTPNDVPVWRYWRAHAHIAEGEYHAAETIAAHLPDEPRRIVNSAVIRARAADTDDTSSVVADLYSRWESTRDPRALLALGELYARTGAWHELKQYVDTLHESVDTLDAIRLAAYTHYHTREFNRCIAVVDSAIPRFRSHATIGELKRLRAGALAARGAIGDAIAEFASLAASNPTTQDLLSLTRLHARAADLHAVAAIARTLQERADLDPQNALALADLLSHIDVRLAQGLWRLAVARQLPDQAAPQALNLGFRLNLDDETQPLLEAIARLASSGESGIRQMTIDQVPDQLRTLQEHREQSLTLLSRGEITLHLFADMSGASLVRILHSLPDDLEHNARPPRGVTAAIRHGGRGVPQPGLTITPGRLVLDLTALLVAEHLDILDPIARTFGPILIHQETMRALLEEREGLQPHQPSQIDTAQALIDAEVEGLLRVVDSLPSWVQHANEPASPNSTDGRSSTATINGYLLELPEDNEDGQGFAPVAASPARATPASILDALRNQGVIMEADSAEHGRKLGRYAEAAPDQVVPPEGAVVFASAPALDVLTSAGLLRAAARHFQLTALRADQDTRRAILASAERSARDVRWLDTLIHRISSGLQRRDFQLLPEAAPDDRTERWSTRLRQAFDLVRIDAETADAVWIDDRCLNRYQRAGRLRVVDTMEMLGVLVQAAAIGEEAYSRLRTRLRAGQFQLLPVTSGEVIDALDRAKVHQEEVQPTETLDALRRSIAASLRGPISLQIPEGVSSPADNLGELPYLLDLTRTGPEVFRALWTTAYAEGADEAALKKAAARADWYTDNVYVDMGLLRSSIVAGAGAPNSSVSAVGLGAIVGYSIELLDILGEDTARNEVARDYLAWVYRRLIEPRWHQDPELQREVIAYLHHMLHSAPEHGDPAPGAIVANRLMAGQVFDALPETLRDALAERPEFLAWAGRAVHRTVPLGDGHYEVRGTLAAIAAALGGATSTVRTVNNDAEARIERADPPHRVAAHLQDGTVVYLDDPAVGILDASIDTRRQVVLDLRASLDVTEAEVQVLAQQLSLIEDGDARFQALIERRESSISAHYTRIGERWARERRLLLSDFEPPAIDSLLRHLRLDISDDQSFSDAWETAGALLVAEEPLEEAFLRLSGLPHPLPSALVAAVRGLPPDELRRRILGVASGPVSPVALVHGIHLLGTLGQPRMEYPRLARRLTRALVSRPVSRAARALELVLERGAAVFESVVGGLDFRRILIATWYHGHRILDAFLSARGDVDWLVSYLEAAPTGAAPTWLFGSRPAGWDDVAHPRYFSPERFLLSGVDYAATADESLLQDQAVIESLISQIHIEGTTPQLPSRSLFRDDSRLTNSLGTFLPIRPDGSAGHRTSEVLALFIRDSSRSHFARDALFRLETSPVDLTAWRALSLLYGDTPVGREVIDSAVSASRHLDVEGLLAAERGDAAVAILGICRYAAMSGDLQAVQRARKVLLQVTAWIAAHPTTQQLPTEATDRGGAGNQENGQGEGGTEPAPAPIAAIEAVLPECVLLLPSSRPARGSDSISGSSGRRIERNITRPGVPVPPSGRVPRHSPSFAPCLPNYIDTAHPAGVHQGVDSAPPSRGCKLTDITHIPPLREKARQSLSRCRAWFP